MPVTEQIPKFPLGEEGEPCRSCGAPLAADQRYCLNCGARRAGPRVDYARHLEPATAGTPRGGGSREDGERDLTPLFAVGALFVLGVMLAVGVLIGKGGNSGSTTAAGPSVIRVQNTGGGGGGTSTTASSTSAGPFQGDWPAGKTGYTVELGTLAKAGSTPADVTAAKQKASSQGAPRVGALDSDKYASLPSGKYVIYSGVYDSKAQATKALGSLKSNFPNATVVKVSQSSGGGGSGGGGGGGGGGGVTPASTQAAQSLQSSSGASYEQQVKHINKPISTGTGKPPPKDNKAPGGGSGGGQTIK